MSKNIYNYIIYLNINILVHSELSVIYVKDIFDLLFRRYSSLFSPLKGCLK